ncbi:MAG: hypothetical protein FWH31_08455 [Streptococcaceae bacterium]|nr:hypothetical protein [Streptococcaceae bacterium]
MEEQKDRSALPTVFGFDFQEVAGLILTLFYLKDVKEISIEGKKQDIELLLNNGKVIYAQAKATTKFESTTLDKFKEGMVTLIENSQLNNAEKLIYVTNSIYPLGKASKLKTFFGSSDKEKRYTFNDFKRNGLNIDSYINKVSNSDVSFDRESFELHFYKLLEVSDKKTKYEVAFEYIQEFLGKIGKSSYKNEVFDLWEAQFHRNAAQKETLSKKDFIWKMVVRLFEVHQLDEFKDFFEFDNNEIDEIEERFGDVINDLVNWYELSNIIFNSYLKYKRKLCNTNRNNRELVFVDEHWTEFQDDIIFLSGDEESREIITKLVIWKILINKVTIKKALNEAGL